MVVLERVHNFFKHNLSVQVIFSQRFAMLPGCRPV